MDRVIRPYRWLSDAECTRILGLWAERNQLPQIAQLTERPIGTVRTVIWNAQQAGRAATRNSPRRVR
jgi:hypothetical protein